MDHTVKCKSTALEYVIVDGEAKYYPKVNMFTSLIIIFIHLFTCSAYRREAGRVCSKGTMAVRSRRQKWAPYMCNRRRRIRFIVDKCFMCFCLTTWSSLCQKHVVALFNYDRGYKAMKIFSLVYLLFTLDVYLWIKLGWTNSNEYIVCYNISSHQSMHTTIYFCQLWKHHKFSHANGDSDKIRRWIRIGVIQRQQHTTTTVRVVHF
jgi:hypothetical protein